MIWKNVLRPWSKPSSTDEKSGQTTKTNLDKARELVAHILEDKRLPESARARLGEDYRQLERLLSKLEKGHIHVAAFGRVGVGKSALLNALAGHEAFAVSVLHGKTTHSEQTLWQCVDTGGVYLLDTPGIDEVNGKEKGLIAETVARQADVILFVIDGDMTDVEYEALSGLYQKTQPIIVVLNKVDQLSEREKEALLQHLSKKLINFLPKNHIVTSIASPAPQLQIEILQDGSYDEYWVQPEPEVNALRELLWHLLQDSGQSYAALNASVFAAHLTDKIGHEIITVRREVAERVIRQYALFKAIAVAINPIPAVDLLALVVDSSMVIHLSKVYGIELTRHEAGRLIRTIAMQTGILLGAAYGIQLFSSVLKGMTAGLSTVLTFSAQAGIAFYGSYVIGKVAEQYFAGGASWGEKGAKKVVEEILADLDKDVLMREAGDAITQIFGKKDGR